MPELSFNLDRSSPVPLYYQVFRQIEAAIERGDLASGARLENEDGLARRWGLSRPTMRRAIQELVDKGLVVRKRGVGTQVVGHGLVEGRVQRRPASGATQLFGEERARRVVQEQCGAPPTGVLDALVAAVRSFADGPLADDLCLVAVRVCGPSPA